MFVLTDEAGKTARVVTCRQSLLSGGDPLEAVTYFRNLRSSLNQTAAYVPCVARIGWHGCDDAAAMFKTGLTSAQIFFRPVFNKEHLAVLGTRSLDELVASGAEVPSLTQCFQDRMNAVHGPGGVAFMVSARPKGC